MFVPELRLAMALFEISNAAMTAVWLSDCPVVECICERRLDDQQELRNTDIEAPLLFWRAFGWLCSSLSSLPKG